MPLRLIPADQLPLLTSYAETCRHPYPLCWHIMLQAGLRVSELCSLSWCDVIHNHNPKTALELDKYCTKEHRHRIIPINRTLADAIRIAWTEYAHPHNFAPANILTASRPNGRGLSPRSIQRAIQQIGRHEIGLHLTPHMLRHTFATRLLKVSDLRTVQEALGHRRVSTTEIYTHVNQDDLRQAIARTDPK